MEKILLYSTNSFVRYNGDLSKIGNITKILVDNEFNLLKKKQYNKNKEDVLKLEIFYIDGMNTQRHFDSKKPDSYNFTNEN